MKIKYADRPNWTRIIDKTYECRFFEERSFTGYISYLSLNKVRERLWVNYAEHHLCIVDNGYVWLQHFPMDGNHVLTATYDQEDQLVQCYFDIVKSVGITAEGIPFCEDLFFDVVALPNGEIYLLDEDELENAYRKKEITHEDFSFAHEEVNNLVKSLKEGTNVQMNTTQEYYHYMKGLVNSKL